MRALPLWFLAVGLVWTHAGADEPRPPVFPFNQRNLDGWKPHGPIAKSKWLTGKTVLDSTNPKKFQIMMDRLAPGAAPKDVELINSEEHSLDLYSEQTFGDCLIELEFKIPQGSNSGIYVMGEYEIQILDTFGKEAPLGPGDAGGIYNTSAPKVNALKKPGEWNSISIRVDAPRFEGDQRTVKAKFHKITMNGEVIHENVEMEGVTPGGLTGKEVARGPLMFQGNHGVVSFRNIKIQPIISDK